MFCSGNQNLDVRFNHLCDSTYSSSLKFDEIFFLLFGWYEIDKQGFLNMQYFQEGDLQCHIRGGIGIAKHDIKVVTAQLLDGLSIMLKEGFAHRDLKPQNFL